MMLINNVAQGKRRQEQAMPVCVRTMGESDRKLIADVVMEAFGPTDGPEIVQLIAELLADPSAQPVLSLVATTGDRVVGHILFSGARVETGEQAHSAVILAPLAVRPDFQSRGIGGRLVTEGLKWLVEAGVDLVFVLGYPDYYSRFGFAEAGVRGFDAPYPIAAKNAGAWMVLALRPGILGAVKGTVRCANALDDPRYWRE
ncbi:GCN5-related N-acetyltransferase [Thioalkalivibrio nitratireducens DSM 14787]|uniref:GCN5-related N-acetyltransferase n=2 Tax=Thioalkalivibrio nitratireducens TaxID=186931 RepID=L0DVX1_THIND|nr:GCN5-related N-acetyltransferase [Thioalkalivibrio nitratireducens DSM 14787]